MKERRREKLASLLRREIAEIVRSEIDLPENIFVTIREVHVSKDGGRALVLVSALKPEDAIRAVEILNRSAGYIHHILGKRLKLRIVPRPKFEVFPGD